MPYSSSSLHQAGFRISWRWLGEMLFGNEVHQFLLLPFHHGGGDADIHLILFLGFLIFILCFFINDQVTGELDCRAGSPEEIGMFLAVSGHFHRKRIKYS